MKKHICKTILLLLLLTSVILSKTSYASPVCKNIFRLVVITPFEEGKGHQHVRIYKIPIQDDSYTFPAPTLEIDDIHKATGELRRFDTENFSKFKTQRCRQYVSKGEDWEIRTMYYTLIKVNEDLLTNISPAEFCTQWKELEEVDIIAWHKAGDYYLYSERLPDGTDPPPFITMIPSNVDFRFQDADKTPTTATLIPSCYNFVSSPDARMTSAFIGNLQDMTFTLSESYSLEGVNFQPLKDQLAGNTAIIEFPMTGNNVTPLVTTYDGDKNELDQFSVDQNSLDPLFNAIHERPFLFLPSNDGQEYVACIKNTQQQLDLTQTYMELTLTLEKGPKPKGVTQYFSKAQPYKNPSLILLELPKAWYTQPKVNTPVVEVQQKLKKKYRKGGFSYDLDQPYKDSHTSLFHKIESQSQQSRSTKIEVALFHKIGQSQEPIDEISAKADRLHLKAEELKKQQDELSLQLGTLKLSQTTKEEQLNKLEGQVSEAAHRLSEVDTRLQSTAELGGKTQAQLSSFEKRTSGLDDKLGELQSTVSRHQTEWKQSFKLCETRCDNNEATTEKLIQEMKKEKSEHQERMAKLEQNNSDLKEALNTQQATCSDGFKKVDEQLKEFERGNSHQHQQHQEELKNYKVETARGIEKIGAQATSAEEQLKNQREEITKLTESLNAQQTAAENHSKQTQESVNGVQESLKTLTLTVKNIQTQLETSKTDTGSGESSDDTTAKNSSTSPGAEAASTSEPKQDDIE